VHIYKELVIGRPSEATLEATLDLSDLNAAQMGVSRRHAKIRRTESGFEVIDLSSRNGTWLNAERLVPNKPYPFASGSQLRLGQMRLLVFYHPVPKETKKS
jgi:pSer/pThr/pTyr-binding forkhead associated (FHA) protein